MAIEVMVDIETLDTTSSALVCSIGAVRVDPEIGKVRLGQVDQFYCVLDWQDQVDRQRTISPHTVSWWLKQSEAARKAICAADRTDYGRNKKNNLSELEAFRGFVGTSPIWANGADFDLVILQSLYKSYADLIPFAWSFRNHRCYRTLKAIWHKDITFPQDRGTAHNALDDAIYQAEVLCRLYKAAGLQQAPASPEEAAFD